MPKTNTEMAQDFLTRLLAPIPADSVIEIRHKKNEERAAASLWFNNIAEIRALDFDVQEHVWFGVTYRQREKKEGTLDGLTWATCVWVDFDRVVAPEDLTKSLSRGTDGVPPATLIVNSGGGIHGYWRFDRLLDMRDAAQSMYLREVAFGLANSLGSDPTVHDPTRVMGLPGTWNVGNGKTKIYDPPRPVVVVFADARNKYSVGDLAGFRRALPTAVRATVVSVADEHRAALPSVLRVPPRLLPLIQTGWREGCGYASRSELDMGVMVAMLNGEHSDQEIYAVFMNPAWEIGSKYREKTDSYLERTLAKAKTWRDQNLTPAGSVTIGTVREHEGRMEVRHEKGWALLCNRTLRPVARLSGDLVGFQLAVGSEVSGRSTIVVPSDAFSTNPSIKRALNPAGAIWAGSDRDAQLLYGYLEEQKAVTRQAVNKIGWHGKQVIFPNAVLQEDGTLVESAHHLYLGKHTGARLVETKPEFWEDLARTLGDLTLRLHTRGAMVPILGWFAASFAAPMVRKLASGAFPILMVFGTPEAGKTTLLELLQRVAGLDSHLQTSTDTLFKNIEAVAGSNSLPVVFDEHRAGHAGRYRTNLYPVLREAYNEGIMARGRSDLSVVRFHLTAPCAIGGETPFRDPALVDRTIHVKLERKHKDPAVLAEMLALPLEQFAVGMYRHVQTIKVLELWERAARLLPDAFRDSANVRQRVAWQTVAFGLLLMENHLVGAEEAVGKLHDFRRPAEEDVVRPTMAVVYEAVRVMGELIKSHRMRDNQDFVLRDGRLWFIPSLVLPMIEEYFQRIETDLPMQREPIMGRMKENADEVNPLVTEYQKVFRMGQRTPRGIALDLQRIEDEMGIPVDYWRHMAVEEGGI